MNPLWRPSTALVRSSLASLPLALAAVLAGRPDLLVLAAPFLVVTAGALAWRPVQTPRPDHRLLHRSLREGEGTVARTTLSETRDVEHLVVALAPQRFTATKPALGTSGRTVLTPDSVARVDTALASFRWGVRPVAAGQVSATSAWSGFRWGPVELAPETLTTLPTPGAFGSRAPTPHPIGLVGTNPARRTGDGTEFASIRPFAPGDRLRRVQWRVSLRTQTLHVTSTQAEEDSSILLVVDALAELGLSGGVHGAASSLDTAVRAAGAIADHYLHRGDRVGLRVLGATRHRHVPTSAGQRQHRRLLDTLARITPGATRDFDRRRLRFGVAAGTTVIVLSPMLSEEAIATTVTLARRGLSVVVVDTVPTGLDLGSQDPRLRLAWRLRALERQGLLRKLEVAGIPVVRWRGPGTLDVVLRRLTRRAARPQGLGSV